MKKPTKKNLLLEQLEERIFLDANPLAAVVDTAEPIDVDSMESAEVQTTTEEQIERIKKTTEDAYTEVNNDLAGDEQASENVQNGEEAEDKPLTTQSATGVNDGSQEKEPETTSTAPSPQNNLIEETSENNDADALRTESIDQDDATEESVELIDPMIGENFTFTVTFDNTTGTTIYGPYIDLLLEGGSEEGTDTDDTDSALDGITFNSATYLDDGEVQSVVINITQDEVDNGVEHPWVSDGAGAPLVITQINGKDFQVGDQFVSLLMPFGSFTVDQTSAEVVVSATMGVNADVNSPLDVEVTTGAMFGTTAQDDPGSDPPLRNLVTDTQSFLPEVIAFNTDIRVDAVTADCQTQHIPPDDERSEEENHQEIPTGPNYPATYVSTIDIADGQKIGIVDPNDGTVSGQLAFTYALPENIWYLGDTTVTVTVAGIELPTGYTVSSNLADSNFGNSGGTLQVKLDSIVTGTADPDDVVITYDFYVPETTGSGTDVLDETTGYDPDEGTPGHVVNDGQVLYSWVSPDNAAENALDATIDAEVDADGNFSDNASIDDISHAQSLAVQKNHELLVDPSGDNYTPGDVIKYTLDVQISDYFSFGELYLKDVLADGMSLYTNGIYTPTITMMENGTNYGTYTLTAIDSDPTSSSTGDELERHLDSEDNEILTWDVRQILANKNPAWGADTILEGDYAADGSQEGPTSFTINYWAEIKDDYISKPIVDGDNEASIDQGDELNGGVEVFGTLYDSDTDILQTGTTVTDNSCDGFSIATGSVEKHIYAINGVVDTNLTDDAAPGGWNVDSAGRPIIQPGDEVSYILTYDMPISSTEDFRLVDYLPLPVYDATDPDLYGTVYAEDGDGNITDTGGWQQIVNPNLDSNPANDDLSFDTASDNLDAGDWFFTSGHTYEGDFSSIGVDKENNGFEFIWDEFHDDDDSPGRVELVFTVKVSDEPFADGLFLTNQVTATEKGTLLTATSDSDIVQVILSQPELTITKGVVETDNNEEDDTTPTFSDNATVDDLFTEPGSSGFRLDNGATISSKWLEAGGDIDTDLRNIDAGDTVTFVIVVENTGHYDAFDVVISDDLPDGFLSPADASAMNFTITTGAGTVLSDTSYSIAVTSTSFTVELVDTVDDGSIEGLSTDERADDDTGDNIIVITYDLVAAASVQPLQQITNTATLSQYTNYDEADAEDNHVPEGLKDSANVKIAAPVVNKTITGTGETTTDGNNVVIGETVTYTVAITVPEGTSQEVTLTDTLDNGLAIVSIDSISLTNSNESNVNTVSSSKGDWSTILASARNNLSNPGTSFSIDFGTLTNHETDNSDDEIIEITYTAVVLNTENNNRGETLNNSVTWDWQGSPAPVTASAPNVTIQEPELQVIKEVGDSVSSTWFDANDVASAVNYDEGDTVDYRITVKHSTESSEDAFDVVFTDDLPTGVDWSGASISVAAGGTHTPPTTYDNNVTDGTFSATWDQLSYTDSTTSQYTTFIISGGTITSATAGQKIVNMGSVTWESLESDLDTPKSSYTDLSYERTGDPTDPGGSANTYNAEDPAVISVAGSIDKVTSPTEYTIGEEVEYFIKVTLPEGETNGLVVTDQLPDGLQYIDGSATVYVTAGASDDPSGLLINTFADTGWQSSNFSVSGGSSDGEDIVITFHDNIDLPGDDDPSGENDEFIIGIKAVVTNIATNHGDNPSTVADEQTDLTNHVSMTYLDPDGDRTDPIPDPTDPVVSVVEPQISTTKEVEDPTNPEDGAQPNDILTYTITLSNTGSADAYEVTADDILPAGVEYFGSPTANETDDDIKIIDNGDGTLFITNSSGEGWDIVQGASVVITYQVQVKGAAYVVGSHTNYVDADWTGLDGDHDTPDDFERVYDDGETQQQWTVMDGVQDEATADFITQVNPPVVGDFVWFDVNGDGNQDPGEPGIDGVEINLYGNNPSNFGEEILLATAVTDSNGWYEFTRLPLTTANDVAPYRIAVNSSTLPGGIGGMNQTAEKGDTLDPDPSLNNQTIFDVANTTDNILDIDFGYTGSGTIGDTVWYDTNQNGLEDETGTGIAGAEVTLRGDFDGDGLFDYTTTTTTGNNGEYSFTNLPFVNYEVSVTSLPGGLSQQTGDPDSTLDSRHQVTLTDSVPNVETVDFGYIGTGSIGDTVWANNDGDNTVDAGESGLANVEVILTGDVNFDGILDTFTTQTDGNGNYSFEGLPEGDYTINVNTSTLPGGISTADANYDLDGGNDSTTTLTLGPGEDNIAVDFGYNGTSSGVTARGSIGDTVWLDLNGDGDQSGDNEIGLAGVTVNLLDNSGTIIETVATDVDGHYFFGGLTFGNYSVKVDTASLPGDEGTLNQTFDLDGTLDNSATVTLDASQRNWDTVDFGYQGKGTIGDTVWLDLDGNGAENIGSGDFGLANVDVTLEIDFDGDGNADATLTTTTGDDPDTLEVETGWYEFAGLPFVDYKVIIDTDDLPDGVALFDDPDGGNDNESQLSLDSMSPTDDGQDFGYRGTGSIGDTVWSNTDGDNVVDGAESGIDGVDVTITGDFNNDGVVSPDETKTIATTGGGLYTFANLSAGDYTVIVDATDVPVGFTPNYDADGGNDATTDVTLTAGEDNTDVDFGFSNRGSIGDTIWLDVNGDGLQDPGEVGLAGVTVTLTDSDGSIQTTTNSNGRYFFGDLVNDTYTVTVDHTTLPSGVIQTFDPDGARDHKSEVTLTDSNKNIDTVDFGYRGQGKAGDTVWLDLDGNSTPNVGAGDFGLANVVLTLEMDFDKNGTTDAVMTTTTDAQGRYQFEGLPYGGYTISVDSNDLPGGISQVVDPFGAMDNQSKFTLDETAPNNLNQDFGYRGAGSIGDTLWQNDNGDSIVDAGEPLLPNISVILTGDFNNDGVIDPTEQLRVKTDSSGQYNFSGLPYGNYTVAVDQTTIPDGFSPNYDADGQPDNSTDVVLDNTTPSINSADFGYTAVANLGDTIWFDYDSDGKQDPGEPGLEGVTVILTDSDGNTFIDSTDASGQYIFTDLVPGKYTVTVDPTSLPTTGLEPTYDIDGKSTAHTATVTLDAGVDEFDVDFGYTGTGSVGDTIWNDQNQNGVQDGVEAGLPGVEISVGIDLNGDNSPDYTVTTTTDSNGNYLVDNLPAGSHVVSVNPTTLPEGIIPSFDPDGTLDNSFTVTLTPGQNIRTVDFGYIYPPEPPIQPPVPPTVVPPPGPTTPPLIITPPGPTPPTPEVADAFFMYRQFGDTTTEFPWDEEHDIPYALPPLPVNPVYTGMAEPGTTLFLTLFDSQGNQVGFQTVMADTAGNWLATFPATLLYDLPHHMEIGQTASSYNNSSPGLFNARTYFNPNGIGLIFSRSTLDVDMIFAHMPSTIMASMHASNQTPFNLNWNDFNGYEFFSPSINPAKIGH